MAYLADGTDDEFEPSIPFLPLVEDRVAIDSVSRGNGNALNDNLRSLGLYKGKRKGRSIFCQLTIRSINRLNGPDSFTYSVRAAQAASSNVTTVAVMVFSVTYPPEIEFPSRRRRHRPHEQASRGVRPKPSVDEIVLTSRRSLWDIWDCPLPISGD